MIINDNNERSEKQGKNTQDYLQKQLDMIMEQKKSKEEQYKETLAFLTAKYKDKEADQRCSQARQIYKWGCLVFIFQFV